MWDHNAIACDPLRTCLLLLTWRHRPWWRHYHWWRVRRWWREEYLWDFSVLERVHRPGLVLRNCFYLINTVWEMCLYLDFLFIFLCCLGTSDLRFQKLWNYALREAKCIHYIYYSWSRVFMFFLILTDRMDLLPFLLDWFCLRKVCHCILSKSSLCVVPGMFSWAQYGFSISICGEWMDGSYILYRSESLEWEISQGAVNSLH